ncbi:MAG: hypothetical protein SFX72_21400 [Isosphaeraceae bacterium]|nr:hypothetical protein [Isosphaeraceae bacterium]
MALDPLIESTTTWISELIADYAAARGWKPGTDYRLFAEPVCRWGNVAFILLVREIDESRSREIFLDLWRIQREKRALEPELDLAETNLLVRSFEQVKEGGSYSIHPGYREVTLDTPLPSAPVAPAGVSPNAR